MAPRKKSVDAPKRRTAQQREALQDSVVDHGYDDGNEVDHDLTQDRENPEPNWAPADSLYAPPAPPGMDQRWVRYATRHGSDRQNFLKKRREGWTPVQAADIREQYRDLLAVEPIEGLGDVIATGDLILCRRPQRMSDQRNAYYAEKLRKQNEAIQGTKLKQFMDNEGRGKMSAEVNVEVDRGVGRVPKVADA